MVTLGILADTHIPDRARLLHPGILPVFRQAGVAAILHAGDISSPAVLRELEDLAPVHAVQGNRDWVLLAHLPKFLPLTFEGVSILLTHGHGRWWNYLLDRTHYMVYGYHFERYRPRLQQTFPQAQVIVFGHTHMPVNQWLGSQLLFNPGSPHFPERNKNAPSVGLLHLSAGGDIRGEIIPLD